jgi:hypothetical protein
MRLLLPLIVLLLPLVIAAQLRSDRDLAGLHGTVKAVETSRQETDRAGKPAYPIEKESTDEYDRSGDLIKTTHHVSGGRTTYYMLDGKRVSKYETIDSSKVKMVEVPVGTAPPSEPKKAKGDPRYEYLYEYRSDKGGRVIAVERYNNDDSLRDARKFTYDAAGRVASETTIEGKGPSFGDVYKYDANGTVIQRDSIFYMANGEKEVTPFYYSKIKLEDHGNWLYRLVTQGEGKDAQIIAIETRKITYH